jgi:hypothetical protein
VCAHDAVTARSSRARRCRDALDGGAVGAGRRQGVAGEHRWGPEVAPGKKIGGGAHPIGGASGGRHWYGAVVTDDGALALHHGEGESEVRWGRD